LHKKYGGYKVFEDINIDFPFGVFALKGRNGVGKSTLLKIIVDLEVPEKSYVSILK